MISITSLTKRYGSFTAVNEINLEVPKGQLFGFLGPNGAGKTTTLRMIAGILQPTSGTIEVAGHDIQREPEAAKSRLGFIPDRPYVYEKLTGAEFLRFVAGHDFRVFAWYRIVFGLVVRISSQPINHHPDQPNKYRTGIH